MASFDNSIRPQFLNMWMYGIWTMIFLHNLGVSVLLYKKRRNGSDFIKVLFNLAGLAKSLGTLSISLVPDDITDTGCQAIDYYLGLANTAYRLSLSTFLLWRIKQIEFKRSDMYIGFSLLAATASLQIARTFLYIVHSTFNPTTHTNFCLTNPPPLINTFGWTSLGFDFAIDLFVTLRLVQILGRANKNAKFVTTNMQKPFKRTLFTSVMYWNFLRLGLSTTFHIITAINAGFFAQITQINVIPACITVVNVALSYLITADAEIVRVIEGRSSDNGQRIAGGSSGTGKPLFKGFGFRHGPTTTESTDYVISAPSLTMTSSQQTEKIDTNTVAVSSMKRLSFFEWAKFVVGKKDKNETNDVEQGSMEEVQEKFQDNTDPEYGVLVTTKEEVRRESDHSLATTVIDSKDNDSMGQAL